MVGLSQMARLNARCLPIVHSEPKLPHNDTNIRPYKSYKHAIEISVSHLDYTSIN